jgi:hypothetical protein
MVIKSKPEMSQVKRKKTFFGQLAKKSFFIFTKNY